MIKITKEKKFWASPAGVVVLFLSTTNYAKAIPPGHIGHVDHSMGQPVLTVFPGAAAPTERVMPRKGYVEPVLVHAPINDVQGFSLTSVSGTKIFGAREDNLDFQVVIQWEVLYHRDGRWNFIQQPVYLRHFEVKVQYDDHERRLIRSVLGYDPFK